MNCSHRESRFQTLLQDPLILPFYVPSFLIFLGYGLASPLLPLYAESFGVSYAWIGAVTSAQAVGMLIADLPSGLLARRMGQRRAMVAGMMVMILARLALSQARSVQVAFLYQLSSGFGVALFGVARHAYVTEHAPIANRGRALALFGGLLRMARFMGPLIGGVIAGAWGLRVALVVSGIVGFPSLLAVALFVPRSAPGEADGLFDAERAERGWLISVLRRRFDVLLPAGLGQIFVQIIRSGRSAVVPLYAAHIIGLSVVQIGVMVSIAAAVEVLMFLPAGWLMDTLGRKYSLVPSFALQALGMACLPLAQSFVGVTVCTSVIGLGNGLSSGSMMTLGADLAPGNARAEFLSVWRLIGDVGGAAGPAIAGIVADTLALPAAALTLAVPGLLAALTFGFLLPETRKWMVEPISTASR